MIDKEVMRLSLQVRSSDNKLYNIKLSPNQKVVETRKGKFVVDMIANAEAAKVLSVEAYALYMYFMRNINGYVEAVSVKNIISATTLSKYAFYNAMKELIEKGYLVKTENEQVKEYYICYERKEEVCNLK